LQDAGTRAVTLTPHSIAPCGAVHRIEVTVRRTPDPALELRYELEGDIERLLVPAVRSSRRADKLWQHTCFEAFVGEPGGDGYCEINLSPSTEWAIYRFAGFRTGMETVETLRPPRIAVQRGENRVSLEARIDLPPLLCNAALRLALSAVIEEADHRLSYWALAHPSPRPDFHHPDSFTLVLPEIPPAQTRERS
jgi:hypothetical protein